MNWKMQQGKAQQPLPGERMVVVGVSGCGKTTTAARLAELYAIPHVDLDALHWQANWKPTELGAFRQATTNAVVGPAWVVSGNYSKVRDLVWPRADTLVWLDYPLAIILWQLTSRTMKRIITREELWNGNRETFRGVFLSKDSLLLWALQSYPRHRREYPRLLASPEYAHLRVVHLHGRAETARWLAEAAVSAPTR